MLPYNNLIISEPPLSSEADKISTSSAAKDSDNAWVLDNRPYLHHETQRGLHPVSEQHELVCRQRGRI